MTGIDKLKIVRDMNKLRAGRSGYDKLNKDIAKIKAAIEKVKADKRRLYDDYNSQIIDSEQYLELMEVDKDEELRLAKQLDIMTDKQREYSGDYCPSEEWESKIVRYKNKRKLTREMVEAFVERVEIHADLSIDIRLKYQDIISDMDEIIAERSDADE